MRKTAILLLATAGAALAQDPERLIDIHCHTAGIGAGGSGCHMSPALLSNWRYPFFLRGFGVTRAELETQGDILILRRISERLQSSKHVSAAVVLAMDGVVDAEGKLDLAASETYIPNEYLAREVPRLPGLLWGASVNPLRPDALERLAWCKAHGAVLVKWLPAVMQFDPADPRFEPFYRKLVELDLPLLTHCGAENAFLRVRDEYSDPERLRLAARLGVKIIVAHAAVGGRHEGEKAVERLARLLGEYPNVKVDDSALTQFNHGGHLRRILARPEFQGRIVYGSDYPLVGIHSLGSPWWRAGRLGWAEASRIARIGNPWDRDVELKHALGDVTHAPWK